MYNEYRDEMISFVEEAFGEKTDKKDKVENKNEEKENECSKVESQKQEVKNESAFFSENVYW